METKKQLLEASVRDLVVGLMSYDRKDDEELSEEDVKKMLDEREVTLKEIVEWFRDELASNYPDID